MGSTGSLGAAIVNELASMRKPVRALVRNPAKARKVLADPDRVEFVKGSVEDAQTLQKAFDGVELFYNCVNLPYQQWSHLPEVHGRIIESARRSGTRMVFPGNVYIYGHAQTERVNEGHPKDPISKKGRIRLQLEESFMKRSAGGEVPSVIVRFPDYYGPNATSVVDEVFRSAIENKKARWFGRLDAMHEFIFVSDAAKAMIIAGERQDAAGQDFNVPGPEPVRVRDWIGIVYREAGSEPRMTGTDRTFVRLAGLANSLAREFAEMQYLTEEPLILDGSKFKRFFGSNYPTRSYEEGIRETLAWMRKNA
ncbi:MAG TPA: NAD-dependent epimerase/dehydratase family protein [Nitrososphaerales archaeon]|nr:NAD-dependent epimerase/dehydratase family protein [Nitrososphaerales archaeon]